MQLRRALPIAWLLATVPVLAQVPGTVTMTPVVERETVAPGDIVRLALEVRVPPGLHLQSDRPRDKTVIPAAVWIDSPAGVTVVDVAYPPATTFRLIGFDEPLDVFDGVFSIGVRVRVDAGLAPGHVTIPARFRYQACDDTTCFNPETVDTGWTIHVAAGGGSSPGRHAELFAGIDFDRAYAPTTPPPPRAVTLPAARAGDGSVLAQFDRFTILDTNGYERNPAAFVEWIDDAEAGVARRGLLDGRGPIAILAIVFVGGLALNLTPCVLPMIPINLAIIGAGARAGRRGRGFLLGSAYGGAMAAVYGLLGLVVILTAGTFGAINASPWFNLGIAALFVFLGLAMFDVVSLDFSRLSSRIRFNEQSRGTVLLAFGMGTVAALLAGACVAPVVVQVIVFASELYAGGAAVALALPFVLGLGMALPWPIAGAGLASLPKPGPWMVRVKQAMGVFILATAAYYAYVGYGILASRWVDPADVKASADAQLEAGWHSSLSEGLRIAERDGTHVLVDFWASWCKNCLVMDRTTLQHPDVVARLASYTRIKFQAEDLSASPARELMQRIGAVGLPAYVILRPAALAQPPAARTPDQP